MKKIITLLAFALIATVASAKDYDEYKNYVVGGTEIAVKGVPVTDFREIHDVSKSQASTFSIGVDVHDVSNSKSTTFASGTDVHDVSNSKSVQYAD